MPQQFSITSAAACVCFMTLSGLAESGPSNPALVAAFDLCTDIPQDVETARSILRGNGWQSATDAAQSALFNAFTVFQFKSDDLDFTFSNAGFMAVSVLGNSALGRDQVGMRAEADTLAVLGVPEGRPYCILTGSDALLETLLKDQSFIERTSVTSDVVTQVTGVVRNQVTATVGKIESRKLAEAIAASEIPEDDATEIMRILNPVTIDFVSSEFEK